MKLLIAYIGPTHAEKSTKAIQACQRLQRLGKLVILIRPVKSIRPDPDDPEKGDRLGMLVTKHGDEFPSLDTESADDVESIASSCGADVVWIDEPPLWDDEDILWPSIQRIRQWADVIVSGCSCTSEGEPFGETMPKIVACADHRIDCKADCDLCASFNTATRSVYIGKEPKVGQVKVGGASEYAAGCPTCWTRHIQALVGAGA